MNDPANPINGNVCPIDASPTQAPAATAPAADAMPEAAPVAPEQATAEAVPVTPEPPAFLVPASGSAETENKEGAPALPQPPEALTVSQCFTTLIIGLIPLVGLLACLLWSWGGSSSVGRQNLAKALLWLHGIFLCLLIGYLILWVFSLAGILPR